MRTLPLRVIYTRTPRLFVVSCVPSSRAREQILGRAVADCGRQWQTVVTCGGLYDGRESLPWSLDAFLVGGDAVDVHRAFLKRFGLTNADVPLLQFGADVAPPLLAI